MCFGKNKPLSHLVKIVRIFMDGIYVEKFTITYKYNLAKGMFERCIRQLGRRILQFKNRAYGNAPCS